MGIRLNNAYSDVLLKAQYRKSNLPPCVAFTFIIESGPLYSNFTDLIIC